LRQSWSVIDKAAETELAKMHLTPDKIAVLWTCKGHYGR